MHTSMDEQYCPLPSHAQQHEKLQQQWERVVNAEGSILREGYKNVAVLIVSWDESLDRDLRCRDEVSELHNLFEDVFGFQSKSLRLESRTKRPQLQLNHAMSNLIFEHDGPSSSNLIIVYYSGHGMAHGDNGLVVSGVDYDDAKGRQPHESYLPQANWNEAEKVLDSTEADVLTILDCCAAGNTFRDSTSDVRAFEVLAAAGRNTPTIGPGPRSFTRAFIDTLKDFSETPDRLPFTTYELHQEIMRRRSDMSSHLFSRFAKPRARHIALAPLSHQSSVVKDKNTTAWLDLRFKFSDLDKIPSNGISILASRLSAAAVCSDVSITTIQWLGFHQFAKRHPFQEAAVVIVLAKRWKRLMRRRQRERNATSRVSNNYIDSVSHQQRRRREIETKFGRHWLYLTRVRECKKDLRDGVELNTEPWIPPLHLPNLPASHLFLPYTKAPSPGTSGVVELFSGYASSQDSLEESESVRKEALSDHNAETNACEKLAHDEEEKTVDAPVVSTDAVNGTPYIVDDSLRSGAASPVDSGIFMQDWCTEKLGTSAKDSNTSFDNGQRPESRPSQSLDRSLSLSHRASEDDSTIKTEPVDGSEKPCAGGKADRNPISRNNTEAPQHSLGQGSRKREYRGRDAGEEAGEDEDSDDERPRKRRGRQPTKFDLIDGREFACPFFKAQPNIYNKRIHVDFAACESKGWPCFRDLEQHIQRNHGKPACWTCGTVLSDLCDQTVHLRQSQPCGRSRAELLYAGFVLMAKMQEIKAVGSRADNGEERWRSMFHALFPWWNEAIPNPYREQRCYDQPAGISALSRPDQASAATHSKDDVTATPAVAPPSTAPSYELAGARDTRLANVERSVEQILQALQSYMPQMQAPPGLVKGGRSSAATRSFGSNSSGGPFQSQGRTMHQMYGPLLANLEEGGRSQTGFHTPNRAISQTSMQPSSNDMRATSQDVPVFAQDGLGARNHQGTLMSSDMRSMYSQTAQNDTTLRIQDFTGVEVAPRATLSVSQNLQASVPRDDEPSLYANRDQAASVDHDNISEVEPDESPTQSEFSRLMEDTNDWWKPDWQTY